jgi:hypothetical protein
MAASGPSSPLNTLLETRIPQIFEELERIIREDTAAETLLVEQRIEERVRRDVTAHLNQSARRLQQSEDEEELAATLADVVLGYSAGAAMLRIEGDKAVGVRIRGVAEKFAEAFHGLEIPLASAAAVAGAVESRDPVIAVTTDAQVSTEMMHLVGHGPEGRVHVYPVVTRGEVRAVLYTWGVNLGEAVELLVHIGAAAWPSPALETPELLTISPAPAQESRGELSWDKLPPAEQQIHLRAQRFARVKVARMRLEEPGPVERGRARHSLYRELRPQIDQARQELRDTFFNACPSMVDYLHLELIHTLAHDDAELLGEDYPGPLL